jgi:hypothetical protein
MNDLRDPVADAASVIAALDPRPHPEGRHYPETGATFRPTVGVGLGRRFCCCRGTVRSVIGIESVRRKWKCECGRLGPLWHCDCHLALT